MSRDTRDRKFNRHRRLIGQAISCRLVQIPHGARQKRIEPISFVASIRFLDGLDEKPIQLKPRYAAEATGHGKRGDKTLPGTLVAIGQRSAPPVEVMLRKPAKMEQSSICKIELAQIAEERGFRVGGQHRNVGCSGIPIRSPEVTGHQRIARRAKGVNQLTDCLIQNS
jgi:hypothetical protein